MTLEDALKRIAELEEENAELKEKIENLENSLYDVHHAEELAFHLVGTAEDMSVVLCE